VTGKGPDISLQIDGTLPAEIHGKMGYTDELEIGGERHGHWQRFRVIRHQSSFVCSVHACVCTAHPQVINNSLP